MVVVAGNVLSVVDDPVSSSSRITLLSLRLDVRQHWQQQQTRHFKNVKNRLGFDWEVCDIRSVGSDGVDGAD